MPKNKGKVERLWVVTEPSRVSELADICFQVGLPWGLFRQIRGGLSDDEIVGFYIDEASAKAEANRQLELRDERYKFSN